jgi:hypothetical protein
MPLQKQKPSSLMTTTRTDTCLLTIVMTTTPISTREQQKYVTGIDNNCDGIVDGETDSDGDGIADECDDDDDNDGIKDIADECGGTPLGDKTDSPWLYR